MEVVNMLGKNITYRVTGRYMSGSNVEAYHLVGEDGSQMMANRDRILVLIGHGQIENMRIQFNDGEAIIRGKGVNLNTLPVYDVTKCSYRGNQASQVANNSGVNRTKGSPGTAMGQFTITKRIMEKNICRGYVVVDMSGTERKISKEKVMELAHARLISNAVLNQCRQPDGKSKIILRGINCNLKELPVIVVDSSGRFIDPSEVEKQKVVYMRAAKMSRGGIIYDKKANKKISFTSGDYILCGVSGVLRAIKSSDAPRIFMVSKDTSSAICDEFLQNLENYPVEVFGGSITTLRPEQVKNWPIVKVTRA